MAEYIEKEHFDTRVRLAVGMAEGDFTKDFTDGVLFTLELLKTEKTADVVEREKINKAIEEMENLETTILGETYEDGVADCLEILKKNIGE